MPSIYPPNKHPSLLYTAEHRLDEIETYIESQYTGDMFFRVNRLPKILPYGKTYFELSYKDPKNTNLKLKENTEILFEFYDSNNNVIFSDISTDSLKHTGIASAYVEVRSDPLRIYEDIEDGPAKLIIVGELEGSDIPQEWENTYNYKCVYDDLQVNKAFKNAFSPTALSPKHSLKTFTGMFSFAKANFSTSQNSRGARYASDGQVVFQDDATDSQDQGQ